MCSTATAKRRRKQARLRKVRKVTKVERIAKRMALRRK